MSLPAFAQITSLRVVPLSVSSAAVPVIVHSVRAPATFPYTPCRSAAPPTRPAAANVTNCFGVSSDPPFFFFGRERVPGNLGNLPSKHKLRADA